MSLDSFEYYSQTFHPGKCLLIQTHTHKCCLVGWSPPSQSLLLLLAAKKPRCSNNLSLEHLLYKCVCVCVFHGKRETDDTSEWSTPWYAFQVGWIHASYDHIRYEWCLMHTLSRTAQVQYKYNRRRFRLRWVHQRIRERKEEEEEFRRRIDQRQTDYAKTIVLELNIIFLFSQMLSHWCFAFYVFPLTRLHGLLHTHTHTHTQFYTPEGSCVNLCEPICCGHIFPKSTSVRII